MKKIRIAIASPSDVKEERDAVPKIFVRWNEANERAILHPVMWESSSVPTLGDHPQHLLNKTIIDRSDLLVAILWCRLGTPTPTASSGTVEEIREFIKKKGPGRVMLYSCTRDIPHDTDPAELAKVQEFTAKMKQQGLIQEYKSVEEFELDLYRHIGIKVEEFLTGQLPPPKPAEDSTKESAPSKTLHVDARLQQPMDLGTTLADISRGFSSRMDEFDAIDGATDNKFFELGAHVYSSVAMCLDKFLTFSAAGMSEENRAVIERISSRLKLLASQAPDYSKKPFLQYWVDGRAICEDLAAQVAHLKKWGT